MKTASVRWRDAASADTVERYGYAHRYTLAVLSFPTCIDTAMRSGQSS